MEVLPSKIQPEIKKSRVSTLLQSHVHSCEYDFVIKLKRVKILDFIISILVFLLHCLKSCWGNGFKWVYCTLDTSCILLKYTFT